MSVAVSSLTLPHEDKMLQVNHQKPKKKAQRCCYKCVEFLSGFFLLMLVATVFTLLRYFLEFSDLPFTFAGNTTELFVDVTTTQAPMGRFIFANTPPRASAMNKIISQQTMAPLKRMSPQVSAQWTISSPQLSTEKSNPWTSSQTLISTTRDVSLQTLAMKPRSPQHNLPITLAKGKTSLPPLSSATKLLSPHPLISAGKPMLSQDLPSAPEPTSAQQLKPAVQWMSPPQPNSATKWMLSPHLTEAMQPKSQYQTTTANLKFPQRLTTFTKLNSPQFPSAMLSSPPRLSQGTSLASPQWWTTAMKQTSPSQPISAIKLNLHPQQATAMKWASPSQPTSTVKSRFLPQLIAVMKQTSPSQPTSAIESVLLPQVTTATKQTFPIKLSFLPQQSTAMKWASPSQPTLTIKSKFLPQLITTMKWTYSIQATSAIKAKYLPQLTTAINPTVAKSSSPQNLTTASPWQMTLPMNVASPQHSFSGPEISGSSGENDTSQYFKGSFHLVNEVYHSSYNDTTSERFRNEAIKLENMSSIVNSGWKQLSGGERSISALLPGICLIGDTRDAQGLQDVMGLGSIPPLEQTSSEDEVEPLEPDVSREQAASEDPSAIQNSPGPSLVMPSGLPPQETENSVLEAEQDAQPPPTPQAQITLGFRLEG